MIKSGRFGQVKMGVDEAAATVVAGLNNWNLSLATEKSEVTTFNDTNKVYVPGMRDISGTIAGFFDSAELRVILASDDDVPSFLELVPNRNETAVAFSGLAYVDAEIEVPVNGAPTLTGNFMAAGAWELPPATP